MAEIYRHINAPRSVAYSALLHAGAIATWRVQTFMISQMHELGAREGGAFRFWLTHVPNHHRNA